MKQRHWWILLAVTITAFIASTTALILRQQQLDLWGHWPLLQFLSGWLILVLLIHRKALRDTATLRRWLLASLTGVLLAVGFPPSPLPFLLFVAFIPLLIATEKEEELTRGQRFGLLYHAFILWNILSTFWVANTAYVAGIFANSVNALLMTMPFLAFFFIRRKLGQAVAWLALPACWLTFEFLHLRPWDLYWPWLTLGNGLAKMHFGLQWYSITGALGGSLWIVVANQIGYDWWTHHRGRWQAAWPLAAWLGVPLIASLTMYATYQEEGDTIEVVSVQPNFEPHYEKFQASSSAAVERFVELAVAELTPETDYLVLPETSFSGIDLDHIDQSLVYRYFKDLITRYPNLKVVTGLSASRILSDPSEVELSTTRRWSRDGDTIYFEGYNCAVQIGQADDVQEYYKALYVPGAEYFPFKRILFFMKPLVDQLGGTSSGYRIRSRQNVFTADAVRVAPVICYESIFGEYVSRFVRKGVQAIFVVTNDGWWDNTAGHRQHTQYAKLRAIECRRDVVRSANMGNCCFINQRGDVRQKTVYGQAAAIRGEMVLNEEVTFYARWGDVLGRISLFFSALLLLRSVVKRIVG